MGEGISDEEEKESDSEQLTEAELSDNPETQSQEKLDLHAKFSKLEQFGYNAAKIPVFPPNPDLQIAIGTKSGVSQVENNYQEKPQGLQPDEVEKDNEQISTEGEKIQFGGGVSGDEDNHKLIQPQVVAGESLAQAQDKDERWKNIDIPGAIAYNKKRYSPETTLVIQDTLILQRFLQVNTENYLGEFNEETIIAIAKWQEAKGFKADGKIGRDTRQSLGITQRLFDDEKGYGFNYFPGQPFVGGTEDRDEIDPNDVSQGRLGNCYFAAGMMAVALANPSLIRELIKDNGDGSYNVTLYTDEGKKVEIKVTPYFPTVAPGVPAYAGWGDEQELWPMLLEKAYAQYKEGYGETGKGEGGYDLIGKGGSPGKVVKTLTGPLTQEYTEKYDYKMPDVHFVKDWDWEGLVRGIKWGLSEHWAVTAATRDAPDGEEKATKKGKKKVGENGIYFNHAYVIESLEEPEGEATPDNTLLNLLNPWGKEHIRGLSMRLFKEYFATLYINPVSQRYVAPKAPVSQEPQKFPDSNRYDQRVMEDGRTLFHRSLIDRANQTQSQENTIEWTDSLAASYAFNVLTNRSNAAIAGLPNNMNIWDFKAQWVRGYVEVIKQAADDFDIPRVLLAGIAYMEVGGDPPSADDLQYGRRHTDPAEAISQRPLPPRSQEYRQQLADQTSFGNLSVQVRRAGESLGYGSKLTHEQSLMIIESLKDSKQNVFIAAKHLSDLRDIDFPGKRASELTRDDMMVIAARYNRGPDPTLKELHTYIRGYGQRVMIFIDENNFHELFAQ